MPEDRRSERLYHPVGRDFVRALLAAGRDLDVENHNSFFDARGGAINIWCRNNDKPACWDKEVVGGTFAADYVGSINIEFVDDDRAELVLEGHPLGLTSHGRALPALSEEAWGQIMAWLRKKASSLILLTATRVIEGELVAGLMAGGEAS